MPDVAVERAQQEDAAQAARASRRTSSAARGCRRRRAAAQRLQRDAAPSTRSPPHEREQRLVISASRERAPPAGTSGWRAARRPGARPWAARAASPGRPRARSPQLGELLVERAGGAAPWSSATSRKDSFGRVERVVGEAEAGDDRGDAALGERGQHGQRAAGADERGPAAGGPLERAARGLQRGQLGIERARLGAVGAEDQLGALGQRVAQQPLEVGGDLLASAGRRRSARTARPSATGTTIVRAWPPSIRCTSSDGSAVVRM